MSGPATYRSSPGRRLYVLEGAGNVAIPGSLPEIFQFHGARRRGSRKDQHPDGQGVALSYEQHIGIPSTCFGETGYYVGNIHAVE